MWRGGDACLLATNRGCHVERGASPSLLSKAEICLLPIVVAFGVVSTADNAFNVVPELDGSAGLGGAHLRNREDGLAVLLRLCATDIHEGLTKLIDGGFSAQEFCSYDSEGLATGLGNMPIVAEFSIVEQLLEHFS